MVRIRGVETLGGFRVRLSLTDGSTREVDLGPYLNGPIFEPVRNDPGDLESLKVRNSPVFQALIAESRRVNPPGTGPSTEEVRRVLAPRRARRARR